MATLTPSERDPVTLDLPYVLSESGVDAFIVENGAAPPRVLHLEFTLTDLPPSLRKRAYRVGERVRDPFESASFDDRNPRATAPHIDVVTNDPAVVIDAWEQRFKSSEAELASAAEERRAKEATEADQREGFRTEMSRWVIEHGSSRLRTAYERGYRVTSLYVEERAAMEFEGFQIDSVRKMKWSERAAPTDAALEVESRALQFNKVAGGRYQPRIVWVTHDLNGAELPRTRKREIVDVPNFLTFYTLWSEVTVEKSFDPDEIPF